jgi:hypothetical protein
MPAYPNGQFLSKLRAAHRGRPWNPIQIRLALEPEAFRQA